MDKSREADRGITHDTEMMITELITLKEDLDTLISRQLLYFLLTLASGSLLIFYVYSSIYTTDILLLLSIFFSNIYLVTWLSLTVCLYIFHLNYMKNIDKKKKTFEEFRMETIEHLQNTWYINEHSQLRDEISNKLESHGINVRYKS
ncbi:DUF2663 family protein [Oceanobacillus saliphilus]|uniref:DUF2663 family protein n=1 Tax=Oceanobacillus saliphilus TaxID=2925834 RepID=UPI00201D35E7|nr:DUF2663 family protein [Oceanobacillus saliphilus]